jgi:hypothetical protein
MSGTVDDHDYHDYEAPLPVSSPPPTSATHRLEISAVFLKDWNADKKQEFIETLVSRCNGKITSVLISGRKLQKVLSNEQITTIMKSLSKIHSIKEFNCFHGKCNVLTTELLAESLPPSLEVLMLWNFRTFSTKLVGTLRQQITLSRISINFPFERTNQLPWGCFDVGVMALCCMEHLRTLQIRCVLPEGARCIRQEECIISPEAMVLLLNSQSIEHLYVENCGLLDDHMDEVYNELPNNKTLVSLNMKDNLFSDDCLYTIGRLLPVAPEQFESLDVTGVSISNAGGVVAAKGMLQNTTLLSLKIESSWASDDFYEEEEDDDDNDNDDLKSTNKSKKNFRDEEWMKDINNQLLYNNAIHEKKSKNRTLMIPSTPYVPPRQLVVDSRLRKEKKTIVDMHTVGEVVTIVTDNMSIVLKDVPSKVSYVVSTLSDNLTTFYQQQKQKQEELQRHKQEVERGLSKTSNAGIPSVVCISINSSSSETKKNVLPYTCETKGGSPFSCTYD